MAIGFIENTLVIEGKNEMLWFGLHKTILFKICHKTISKKMWFIFCGLAKKTSTKGSFIYPTLVLIVIIMEKPFSKISSTFACENYFRTVC